MGVIIWLDQEGRGNGHLALMRSRALQEQGLSQTEAYVKLGYEADARRYTRAAEIVHDLGDQIGPTPDQQPAESCRFAGCWHQYRGHSTAAPGPWDE